MRRASVIFLAILISTSSSMAYAYGGIHNVRSYERTDGTYVESHLSGNPGSGIHCHYNVCE
jgi:hypothetical protein